MVQMPIGQNDGPLAVNCFNSWSPSNLTAQGDSLVTMWLPRRLKNTFMVYFQQKPQQAEQMIQERHREMECSFLMEIFLQAAHVV